jgi:hypothetical protein
VTVQVGSEYHSVRQMASQSYMKLCWPDGLCQLVSLRTHHMNGYLQGYLGEFFDLEALSVECRKHGRYSFFFTSMPLNLAGGVGSPPNVLAIF